jgi:hypothetical protein
MYSPLLSNVLSRTGHSQKGPQNTSVNGSSLYFPVYNTDIPMGNHIILNKTMVQKDNFVGKFYRNHSKHYFSHFFSELGKNESGGKKEFGVYRNGDLERSGSESCWIQSQEDTKGRRRPHNVRKFEGRVLNCSDSSHTGVRMLMNYSSMKFGTMYLKFSNTGVAK